MRLASLLVLAALLGRAGSPPPVSAQQPVSVVLFWATWCGHCKAELAALDRIAAERPAGVRVLGVSVDAQGWRVVTPFLRQHRFSLPVALATREVLRAHGLKSVPEIVPTLAIFGPDGQLKVKAETALGEAGLRRLVAAQLR